MNCLTEVFVERALARAAELDEHLKRTGKVVGPLHGLPISLKDHICIKGLEATMGYVAWIGKYSAKDAVLVEILYECGAVPFVQTNVPQTLMVRLAWLILYMFLKALSGEKPTTTYSEGQLTLTTVP